MTTPLTNDADVKTPARRTANGGHARGRHHLHLQMRDRVEALYRQSETEQDPTWFTGLDHRESAPGRFSLTRRIQQEFSQRGLRAASPYLLQRAGTLALWALKRDPNEAVAVEFSVSHVLTDIGRMVFHQGVPANQCLQGRPRMRLFNAQNRAWETASCSPVAFKTEDRRDLARLPKAVRGHREDETLWATWEPSWASDYYTSDPMRPPVEAVAVAARIINEHLKEFNAHGEVATDTEGVEPAPLGAVLTIGMGFLVGSAALSAMLSGCIIHMDSRPFKGRAVPQRAWDAVVVNIPTHGAYEICRALDRDDVSVHDWKVIRERNRGHLDARIEHLPEILAPLHRLRSSRTSVIVLADPQVQGALASLLGTLGLVPIGASRGIYVDYTCRPRMPRGLPASTGRVVTEWRFS